MVFKSEILPNGLTIVTDEVPNSMGASVHWVLRRGMKHENYPGAGHFCEHIVSSMVIGEKGEKLWDRIKQISPNANFGTGLEWMDGYADILPEFLPEMLDHFCRIASRPEWTEAIMEQERTLILNEHDEGQKEQYKPSINLARAREFPRHPLGRNILGEPENIQAMTSDHIREFIRQNFLASEMALVISGPTPHEEVLRMVRNSGFHHIPSGPKALPEKLPHPPTGQYELIVRPKDEQFILLTSPGFKASDPRRLPSFVMTMMLENALDSFLRDEGYSYQGIRSCYSAGFPDHGSNVIGYFIAPEKAELSLRAVAEFIGTPKKWLTIDRFNEYILKVRTANAHSFLTPGQRASSIAFKYEMTGQVMPYEEIEKGYELITFQDVVKAYTSFRATPLSVYGHGPLTALPGPAEVNALVRGEGPQPLSHAALAL